MNEYYVALFKSVQHVLKAEKILKEKNINFKIIPVPKSISTECGVCIRFIKKEEKLLKQALLDKIEIIDIVKL